MSDVDALYAGKLKIGLFFNAAALVLLGATLLALFGPVTGGEPEPEPEPAP
eukprot:COSAG05_NODE_2617_length_2832_cov_3.361142_6_plen_51_part_00